MKTKGFIEAVNPSLDKDGNQRTWTSEDGKVYEFWTAELALPYTKQNGEVEYDRLVADICREKCAGSIRPYNDYIHPVSELAADPYNLTVVFSKREYNGRKFNSIKLLDLTLKAQ